MSKTALVPTVLSFVPKLLIGPAVCRFQISMKKPRNYSAYGSGRKVYFMFTRAKPPPRSAALAASWPFKAFFSLSNGVKARNSSYAEECSMYLRWFSHHGADPLTRWKTCFNTCETSVATVADD